MKRLANASIINPAQTIRVKAMDIIKSAGVPPRDYMGEVNALHAFVRDEIRYIQDPLDYELVSTPEKTLELGQEDCDGKSTLLAALLKSTGHPAQFVAVGFDNGPFSHVLVLTRVGRGWIPLETIINKPPGWFPPDTTSKYFLDV